MSNYYLGPDGRVYSEEELYHYGVLGMKWGVRRGNSAKAYERASKKLQKLSKKADKAIEKAYKKRDAADRKMNSWLASEKAIAKAQTAANESMKKAAKKANKARKWVNAMDKVFKNTPESLSKEQIDLGKKYTEIMNNRVFGGR